MVSYLRERLGDDRPERLALHGSADRGDIGHIWCHGYQGVAECKNHKDVTPALVERWREQTVDERDEADADFGLLVVSVYRAPIGRSVVHVTLRDLARIALPVRVNDGWADLADDHWASMTLAECCELMRGNGLEEG